MSVPHSTFLPTPKLAASLANTSATYKYYWLLAILESVEEGHVMIPKRSLFAKMVATAWYTVNYFHVSFGSQDVIQSAVRTILEVEKVPVDIKKGELITILKQSNNALSKHQQNLNLQ
jgi:hypothetical protein